MTRSDIVRMAKIDINRHCNEEISKKNKIFYNYYRQEMIKQFEKDYLYWKNHTKDFLIEE